MQSCVVTGTELEGKKGSFTKEEEVLDRILWLGAQRSENERRD